MKLLSTGFAVLIVLFSVAVFAGEGDPTMKFSKSVELASYKAASDRLPDIASNGSRIAIVYDDYDWSKNSCSAYLVLVDTNGNITKGPIKLSNESYSLSPQIVWTGSKFGILYAAGNKNKQNYYLACYNSSGNKISQKQLPGSCTYIGYTDNSRLIWMGNHFGAFYYAKFGDGWYQCPGFYKTSGSGPPSEEVVLYDDNPYYMDIIWDGSRFLMLAADSFQSWKSRMVVQLLVLDSNGKLKGEKSLIGPSSMLDCDGTAIIQLKKKNRFLAVIAGDCKTGGAAPPADTRRDLFAAPVKAKKKGVGNLNLNNVTRAHDSGWAYPQGINVNGKTVVGASHGCGIGVAVLNDKGQVTGKPLHYEYGY